MTSFFNSPASKPSILDGIDSINFDFLDTPEAFSFASTPLELAAKISYHQSFAYQPQMDPHKQDMFRAYNPDFEELPPDTHMQVSEPMHRQLHAQLLRQNASDILGQCAPPIDTFGATVSELCIIPEFVSNPVDCSFMELSFTDSHVDYDPFPVLDNGLFRGQALQQLLQQPVPRKPEPPQRQQIHSTPSSTALSILTPVSSVADDTWAQYPAFAASMGHFATAPTPLRQPQGPPAPPYGPGARKPFKNTTRSFARTPELPMCLINHQYLNSAAPNKAEVALSWASLPQSRRRLAANSPYTSSASLTSTAPASSRSALMLLTHTETRKETAVAPPAPAPPAPPAPAPPKRPQRHQKLIQEQTKEPEPVPKKKHKRRHTQNRSRLGCWICRIKHLKCDETRPVCNHCKRFGVACDYNPERPAYVFDRSLRRKKLDELAAQRRRKRR